MGQAEKAKKERRGSRKAGHLRSDGTPKETLTKAEAFARGGELGAAAYPCRECDAWHVGNDNGGPKEIRLNARSEKMKRKRAT